MTFFTVVARTSFTPRLKFSAREAGDDAVEKDECGRAADAVCDSGGQRQGAHDGALSRVWDFAAHGLSLATALPADGQSDEDLRAQPSAAPQPVPYHSHERAACGGLAPANGLGREKVAGAVARRRDSAGGADHPPDPGASRSGQRRRAWSGTGPLRALGAERVVADGQQRKISVGGWRMSSAVDRGRSQPLRGGALCAAGVERREGFSVFGGDLPALWSAAGHADGPRHVVVVGLERLGIDAALGAADRARDSAFVRPGASPADPG